MPTPTVSIVLPAARAARTIGKALDAVQTQDYPNVVDVIVAAADEETANAARRSGVEILDNPKGSTPAALNLAIAAGQGQVVVRVDAHSTIPANYVSTAVDTLVRTGADNVGGMQVPVGETFWGRAIAAAMSSPVGSGDARYRIGGEAGPVETVYLGCFWREKIEALGGFDERFERHQDYELNERIRESGGTVWFDPDLKVDYRPRSSLRALARQYYDYGAWKRIFSRSHPGSLLPRQMAPPVLTIGLLLAMALSVIWPELLVLPAIYVLALAAAAFSTLPRSGIAFVGVPVALATMHLAWGSGFLLGHTRER